MDIPNNILNPQLYRQAKIEADRKYKKHSLYKSAYLVKRYTELGGKYSGTKPKNTGITRWLKDEEWIQVKPFILKNKKIPCGSTEGKNLACRPSKGVKGSPITIQQSIEKHGKKKVLQLAQFKEKNKGRINWVTGTVSP